MSTHANIVKMSVTSVADAGVGTITLGAAVSGWLHLNAQVTANATVDIRIVEGTKQEVCRNCTFTYSATPSSCTVTRGTLESGTNGASRETFTSAAVVSVVATAAFGNNAALNHVAASPTSAGVTGVVGTMHLLDISGLTASRNFTLPATAAVGDRVGVYITTGDDTYALIIIGDTGDTINGGSAATEWSRLFIANECVILRCVTANSAWVVEYDGRIAGSVFVSADGSTAQTITASTGTKITTALSTVVENSASEWSAANSRFTARRTGIYFVAASLTLLNMASGKAMVGYLVQAGSVYPLNFPPVTTPVSGAFAVGGSGQVKLTAGDTLEFYAAQYDTVSRDTTTGANENYFQIMWTKYP